MRHCLQDPNAETEFGGGYFTVFSCEYDDGKRVRTSQEVIRVGDDGKIMLLLCQSCLDQLRTQFLQQIILEAIRMQPQLLDGAAARTFIDNRKPVKHSLNLSYE